MMIWSRTPRDFIVETADAARTEVYRLRTEVDELRRSEQAAMDTMEPFAAEAAELPSSLADDEPYWIALAPGAELVASDFVVGDLRRAIVAGGLER